MTIQEASKIMNAIDRWKTICEIARNLNRNHIQLSDMECGILVQSLWEACLELESCLNCLPFEKRG
jgi:hypothetical protein